MPFVSKLFSTVIVYTHVQRCREDLCNICAGLGKQGILLTAIQQKMIHWPLPSKGQKEGHDLAFSSSTRKAKLISRALSTQALCHDRVKTFPLHCLTTGRHTQTYRVFLPRSINTYCRPETDSRGLPNLADEFTPGLALVIKQAGVSTKWIPRLLHPWKFWN